MTGRHPTDTQESLPHTPLWSSLGRIPQPVKPELHLDKIVDTAITLADNAGIDALTMRKVALALDVGTMTLYTYLPGKTELLAAMVEEIHRRTGPRGRPAGGWRLQLAELARRHLHTLLGHPWLLSIPDQIHAASAAATAHSGDMTATVEGIGLTQNEKTWLVNLVGGHVHACAKRAQTTLDIFPEGEPAKPWADTTRDFEFGLQRILDGTAHLIRSRA